MASVRGNIVSVRSGPSKSFPILWKICRQCPVMVLERKGDWSKIRDYEGDIGWIHKSALFKDRIAVVVSDEAIINSNDAKIRSGPGGSYEMLDQLEKGSPVRILERDRKWARVKYDIGKVGWVSEALLANVHTGDVNIRTGPGIKHDIVFKTRKGVIFRIIGRKGAWLNIDHETGHTGWIREDLVWGE